jgi:hypothetical protein
MQEASAAENSALTYRPCTGRRSFPIHLLVTVFSSPAARWSDATREQF